jgi:hypothetical protein
VAVYPLRVQELAEILAIDFGVGKGIPKRKFAVAGSRTAVLTACSSLIDVDFRNPRMVQFSQYSVKEFLTSDRLAASTGSVARPSYSPRARTYYFDQGMRRRVTSF